MEDGRWWYLVFFVGDDFEKDASKFGDIGLNFSVNECRSLMVNYIPKYQIIFLK